MNVTFLSRELVTSDYSERLRQDMERAKVLRFVVAYVSDNGLVDLGNQALVRALANDQSFGVASLNCRCGYQALLGLQARLPALRLKYFMDPHVQKDDERDGEGRSLRGDPDRTSASRGTTNH